MKKIKTLYWVFTGLIVLLDGVMPALTSHTELARQGISHLGFPDYFRVMLTVFKVSGALVLILPFFKGWIKEWAYAGFAFNFTCAAIAVVIVDGFGAGILLPLFALALLAGSHICYHKLHPALKIV